MSETKTGMVCPLDSVGRFVIPASMREGKGFRPGERVQLSLTEDENGIRMEMSEDPVPRCAICGCDTRLSEFHGKHICATCKAELWRKVMEEDAAAEAATV